MKSFRLEVYGRVQGVNFRKDVKAYADKAGLKGFVANREDGSVLAVVRCKKDELNDFIFWLKESPGFSSVKGVKVREVSGIRGLDGFRILRRDGLLKDKGKSFGNLCRNFWGG